MKFLKDNWKALLLVLMAVVAFPLILILSFNNKSPFDNVYGSNDAWIGFWGSYAGGLMTASASGGLVDEVTSRFKKERNYDSFEDLDEFIARIEDLVDKQKSITEGLTKFLIKYQAD